MSRMVRSGIAIALWGLAVVLSLMGYNPLESALYATIALFVHPATSAWLINKARDFAGVGPGQKSLDSLDEEAKKLRVDAGKDRILGQFDAAYTKYKRAYELYVKIGDKDAQCNVLCSLAETTPRMAEIRGYVEKIEAICVSLPDPNERAKCLRNLAALKQRLKDARNWAP